MTARPATLPVRAHEMGIYKRYFDLIASGRKTTEIRVNDASRRKIKPGSLIRFRCRDEHVLTRVARVARYSSFEEMFDHEEAASVNPTATREEQLANIRQIYPPSARRSVSWRSASSWSTRREDTYGDAERRCFGILGPRCAQTARH